MFILKNVSSRFDVRTCTFKPHHVAEGSVRIRILKPKGIDLVAFHAAINSPRKGTLTLKGIV